MEASRRLSFFESWSIAYIKLGGPFVELAVCVHTHRRFKITLPNTDKAHEKYL